MPIYGVNDHNSLQQSRPQVDIKVFKGTKKLNRNGKQIYGQDLRQQLRVETANPQVRYLLKQSYQAIQDGDSLMVECLNICMAFGEVEQTFPSSMKLYDASGLKMSCDRQRIYQRFEEYQDAFSHVRRRPILVDEPCPVAGTTEVCPHGCQAQGTLYFYIRELLKAGFEKLAAIDLHGYTDLSTLPKQLVKFESDFSSIKRSPFPCPATFGLIPYILTRTETKIKRPITEKIFTNGRTANLRTGKKTDDTTWALTLDVDPLWKSLWQQWQQIEVARQLGYQISPKLLEGVVDGEIVQQPKAIAPSPPTLESMPSTIEPIESSIPEILPTEPSTITQQQWQQLDILRKEIGWSKNSLLMMLREEYGYTQPREILAAHFAELYESIADPKNARKWSEEF